MLAGTPVGMLSKISKCYKVQRGKKGVDPMNLVSEWVIQFIMMPIYMNKASNVHVPKAFTTPNKLGLAAYV